ncbi:MAG: uracil-DNA glycosylase [Synergistaceae bacterium]|nr:uracil-DNA glycosylase [Synergistaceae bacterium]
MQKSLAGYSLGHIAEQLRSDVEMCRACPLGMQRQRVVFGQGKMSTDLMLIGEAPGAEEDEQGVAFVGKAGQLLTKILEAATISRDDIFITNVVKCRPPQNRNPSTDEVIACNKFLEAQIAIISPKIIVTLGNVPTRWFLKTSEGITSLRGRWFDWRGISLMPLYHPSYLLRNQSRAKGSPKDLTWNDIKEVKKRWDKVKLGD